MRALSPTQLARRSGLVGAVAALVLLVTACAGASTSTAPTSVAATPSGGADLHAEADVGSPARGATAPAASPAEFQPVSASFLSPDEGWVLGHARCPSAPSCTALLHTTDAGAHWTPVAAPTASIAGTSDTGTDSGQVSTVLFTSKLDGWAWGPGLYATHDGGTSWRQVDANPVLAVDAASGTAWALVAGCPAAPGCTRVQLLHSSTANDLWSATDDAISTTNLSVDVLAEPTYRWVLAGGMVYAARTGDPLKPLTAPCDDPAVPAALEASDDHQIVVQCAGPAGTVLEMSDDAGAHWSTPFAAPADTTIVATNGQGILLAATGGSNPTVLRSSDGGQTWAQTVGSTHEGGTWTDVAFTSPVDVTAVLRDHQLIASHDGGGTWKAVSLTP